MAFRDLSVLLIRISGVWLIAYGIMEGTDQLIFLFSGSELVWWELAAAAAVAALAPLAIGVLLFMFPYTVTNRIVTAGPQAEESADWSGELERIAMSVVGVVLLVRAGSDVVYLVVSVVMSRRFADGSAGAAGLDGITANQAGAAGGTLLELALALWLILGSRGLVAILRKVRGRG